MSVGFIIANIKLKSSPKAKSAFAKTGENISYSRRVARAHYKSDSKMGEQLGNSMYKHIKNKKGKKITVEVDNLAQLKKIMGLKFDRILLDNMNPLMVKKAVKIIRKQPQGNNIFIEASGGINYESTRKHGDK